MKRLKGKIMRWIFIGILVILLFLYCYQCFWIHENAYFVPDYPRIALTESTSYESIYQQTGLGKSAVDRLLSEERFDEIQKVQDAFFSPDTIECVSIFSWITMSDRIQKEDSAPLVDLQPGDILLSLSTHSLGWRHGHVGLVLDEERVLECTTIGKDSSIVKAKHWRKYSNYVVLRVKGVTDELQQQVVSYAKENLCGIPYHLSAGFIGKKAPNEDERYFGLQCAYLVWYAWQKFGYDLDSDGGRLVTANDLMNCDKLEVVQVYGCIFTM